MMRRRGLNPKSIRRGELAGHLGLLAGTGSVFLVAGLGVCLFVRNLLQDVDVE